MRAVVATAPKRAAITFNHALVAQRIEQEPSNLLAAGSTPAEGTIRLRIIKDSNHESESQTER